MFCTTFGVVQKYIWGNVFVMEFHADTADTLLWANADLENGGPFKPSMDYAYKLIFGGQWLFMPFIKLFGISLLTQRCSMSFFSVLFAIVLIFFFKSMDFSNSLSFLSTAIMLTSVCITKKTREIYYSHIIHYSLAVFYFMLAFIFFQNVLRKNNLKTSICCYTAILMMCSINGLTNTLYVSVPILAACLIEFCLNKNKTVLTLFIITIISIIPSLILTYSGKLDTGYVDNYYNLAKQSVWTEQLMKFPVLWLSLFNDYAREEAAVTTEIGLKSLVYTFTGLFTFIGFMVSSKNIALEKDAGKRVFYISTLIMFYIVLFFIVFGKISNANWRLTPVIFSAQLAIIIQFFSLFFAKLSSREIALNHGQSIFSFFIIIFQSIIVLFSMIIMKYDETVWFDENGLLETLRKNNLTYGYTSNYWFGHSLTVLSDNEIKSRKIEWNGTKPILPLYSTNRDIDWYDDQPNQSEYFLILNEKEYNEDLDFIKEAQKTFKCYQYDHRNLEGGNYYVLIYDYNIMKSEYDLLSAKHL